jgi:hypothetical protein
MVDIPAPTRAEIPYLAPPTVLERWRSTWFRIKRSIDEVSNRSLLRSTHQRKRRDWEARIADVLACPDNALLPRVRGAGQVIGNVQLMHNGLKVVKDCYYRWRGTLMFEATAGSHEPQEERVFAEVLKHMPPKAVMIELGAYWGFYSMWFAYKVTRPRCLLVEPLLGNLDLGRENFRLNELHGEFVRAKVGARSDPREAMVCVDDLVEQRSLDRIDILHCDIQGFEGEMLKGAARTLGAGKVHFIFISTHSKELHVHCRSELLRLGYDVIADADLQGTFSVDGILVGQRRGIPGPGPVVISQRPGPR